jgi:hypothetical protein
VIGALRAVHPDADARGQPRQREAVVDEDVVDCVGAPVRGDRRRLGRPLPFDETRSDADPGRRPGEAIANEDVRRTIGVKENEIVGVAVEGDVSPVRTRSVNPVTTSWTNTSDLSLRSSATRSSAELSNAIQRPSADSEGLNDGPLDCAPSDRTLIRRVLPVWHS